MPDMVTTAVREFKKMWRQTKARRPTPFPKAVRAKLRLVTSRTAPRVVRKMAAAMPRLRTKAGKMICWKLTQGLVKKPTESTDEGK